MKSIIRFKLSKVKLFEYPLICFLWVSKVPLRDCPEASHVILSNRKFIKLEMFKVKDQHISCSKVKIHGGLCVFGVSLWFLTVVSSVIFQPSLGDKTTKTIWKSENRNHVKARPGFNYGLYFHIFCSVCTWVNIMPSDDREQDKDNNRTNSWVTVWIFMFDFCDLPNVAPMLLDFESAKSIRKFQYCQQILLIYLKTWAYSKGRL